MSIPRVWPNGAASMPVDARGRIVLSSADAARLDGAIQRAADKTVGGSSIGGHLAFRDGGKLSLDSNGARVLVNGKVRTSNGGRLAQGGTTRFPEFDISRSRTVRGNLLEGYQNFSGDIFAHSTIFNFNAGGFSWRWSIQEATNHGWALKNLRAPGDGLLGALVVPLTRVHDGATLEEIQVEFFVNPARTTLPNLRYPSINGYRYDPFLGKLDLLYSHGGDFTKFPPAGSLAAYKNGGNANLITFAADQNNVIDLSRYWYFLAVADEDYGAANVDAGSQNEFGGYSMRHVVDWMQPQ